MSYKELKELIAILGVLSVGNHKSILNIEEAEIVEITEGETENDN